MEGKKGYLVKRGIYVYGDSLLKATVPDEELRYHFHLPEIMARYPSDRVEVTSRAKMGATVTKGLTLVEHDLERGLDADYALVAYGGNDSDYDWAQVAEDPQGEHRPHTELPDFRDKLTQIIASLRERHIQPVLMSLPPIDGGRYLNFICRGGLSRSEILRWLGDEQMIYRHQELYSDAVSALAWQQNVPIITVREAFLGDHRMASLLSADGIHLNMAGYEKLFDTLADWLRRQL